MASGRKQLIVNTQERAMSVDINRLQSFGAADDAEFFRYLLDTDADDDASAGGTVQEHLSLENPLRAEIINGFLVTPQVGGLGLSVSAGVMYAVAPDSAPDDSVYKYIRAPAIALGALTFAAGATDTRIDIVEMSFGTTTSETASRDVFNDATGLFTATSLPKAVQSALLPSTTIRVRQGTAGGGFPGTASGWLPLMVARVPASATSCDGMDFWDVRPLVADREFGITPRYRTLPATSRLIGRLDAVTTPSHAYLQGYFEGSVAGRRVGGNILRGHPLADPGYIDLNDSGCWDPAVGSIGTGFYYLYFLMPFGLPRWARYARLDDFNSPSTRYPRSPRGIPVLSHVAPTFYGLPSAPVGLPTSFGFGSSSPVGLCAAVAVATSGTFCSAIYDGTSITMSDAPVAASGTLASSNTVALFTIADGVTHPANARAMYVDFLISGPLPTATMCNFFGSLYLGLPGNANPSAANNVWLAQLQQVVISNTTGSSMTANYRTQTIRVPLVNPYPFGASANRIIALFFDGTGLSAPATVKIMTVRGYELGP